MSESIVASTQLSSAIHNVSLSSWYDDAGRETVAVAGRGTGGGTTRFDELLEGKEKSDCQ